MAMSTSLPEVIVEQSFRELEHKRQMRELLLKPTSVYQTLLETVLIGYSPLLMVFVLQSKLALSSVQFFGLMLALSLPANYLLYRLRRAEKRVQALLELSGIAGQESEKSIKV